MAVQHGDGGATLGEGGATLRDCGVTLRDCGATLWCGPLQKLLLNYSSNFDEDRLSFKLRDSTQVRNTVTLVQVNRFLVIYPGLQGVLSHR